MNTRTFRLAFAIAVLAAALLYMTQDSWFTALSEWYAKGSRHVSEIEPPPVSPPPTAVGKTFAIKRVKVLKGDQFDIVLDDETRILARLMVHATENSKGKVIDLINSCENPKARLVRKLPDGQWLVDIQFKQGGKDCDLATWLSDNKMVYQ